jgi:hypothetical protein
MAKGRQGVSLSLDIQYSVFCRKGHTLDQSVKQWQSIRRVEDFRPVLGDPGRAALIWFAVACVARIRHLLVPDAIQVADLVESYAEGRLDRPAVLEAYQAFVQAHYTPHIVRDQSGTEDIDIGQFDTRGSEAVAAAAYLVVGNLIYPEDDRFDSTREMFWLAEGMAESCRHAIMATIPDLPWHQEELPPDLEPFRAALLGLPPDQLRQIHRTPELDLTLHGVHQALLEANNRRQERRNAAWETEELEQCKLAREVIRPPFVTSFAPSWRTTAVLAVARGIYEDRAFDCMPILADPLQEAGCEDAHLLGHCRGPGPHVRGCWAVHLVLGPGT